MNYRIVEEDGFYLIEVSGKTRKNEAVIAKRRLFPYFKEMGRRVIIDMKELEGFEPITVIGILSSIRKEINLLRGELRLCSLKPELMDYITQNRLDRLFCIYENKETAKKNQGGNDGKQ
jgi:anti-anti-sigma factor